MCNGKISGVYSMIELRPIPMGDKSIFIKYLLPCRAVTTIPQSSFSLCFRSGSSKLVPCKISRKWHFGWVHSMEFLSEAARQRHERSLISNTDVCRRNPSGKIVNRGRTQKWDDPTPAVKHDNNVGDSRLEEVPSTVPKARRTLLESKLLVRRSSTSAVFARDDDQGDGSGDVSQMIESAAVAVVQPSPKNEPAQSKKQRRHSPEGQLRFGLDMCSKRGDLMEAISLYDQALTNGVKLNQHHYNVLLYICSSAAMGVLRAAKSGSEQNPCRIELNLHVSNGVDERPDKNKNEDDTRDSAPEDDFSIQITEQMKELALKRGFEIYERMRSEKIPPNEATFTAVARLAVANEDGDFAFEMVKQMEASNITPRLRSYSPALFAFCKKLEVEKAYEVDTHMIDSGVQAEEPELKALLKLSADACREEKVYSLLHRLRASVRQVSPSTADVIEQWFKSKTAAEVGTACWDTQKISKSMAAGGGGWHGQGWLGQGNWKVEQTTISPKGVCRCCREQLVTIDIDPLETENFAKSIAALACEREAKSTFTSFQEWLDHQGPYEAIVDGANVGLHQQNFGDGHFRFSQLNAIVNGLRQRSPSKKWPLIILHNRRARGGPADNPRNKQLIQKWKEVGALYATPNGSNDDWYWLYAAVRFKCLLITADEMRDHLFELLGNDFFPKWKERHQVRFTFSKQGPQFHMPPPYSIVIQESDRGWWHVPMAGENDMETSRIWLCITRPGMLECKKQPIPASQERKTRALSQGSEPEGTRGGAVFPSNTGFEEAEVSRGTLKKRSRL